MNCLFWNVRGLNALTKQKEVVNRLKELDISLVGLLETKVKKNNCTGIIDRYFSSWNFVNNYTEVENGRIWALWKGSVQAKVFAVNAQCLTLKVTFETYVLYVSIVYAFNKGIDRRDLWCHLIDLYAVVGGGAWLLAGDFNVFLNPEECTKYSECYPVSSDVREFRDCIEHIGVFDHPFGGAKFTWTNHQDDTFQVGKLDRILIGSGWLDEKFSSSVTFLSPGISDHCPGLLKIRKQGQQPPRPFKFFNFWADKGSFLDTVRSSWEVDVDENPMENLFRKLKRLKPVLRDFNKRFFSNIFDRIKIKKEDLRAVQDGIMQGNATTQSLALEKQLLSELTDLLLAEESFYRQKSRIRSVAKGDSNTKFFHKMLSITLRESLEQRIEMCECVLNC
ncbi:hypothetical protein PTKIN_Ptkin12aG0110000 [Pterospermum kingtungense]